ncbi:hypothetical protein D3C80_1271650 [compost metagenome]
MSTKFWISIAKLPELVIAKFITLTAFQVPGKAIQSGRGIASIGEQILMSLCNRLVSLAALVRLNANLSLHKLMAKLRV